MIVLNNKESTEHPAAMERKKSLEDLFRLEIDAYCDYKEWREETDDTVLEMALEEIMMDEYLHAKFLRDYMIDKDMYTLSADDPHEKKFWKIHKKIFRD
jgi:hypothetical protein